MVSWRKKLVDLGRGRTNRSRSKAFRGAVETLETRQMLTTYTMPLVNQTGLDPTKFAIYVLGYSTANQLELQTNGTFGSIPAGSGHITSYKVGTGAGELSSISWTDSQPMIGAVVDFFVVPISGGSFPVPYLTYTGGGTNVTQPTNPPGNQLPNGQGAYVNQTIEITQPSSALPTIDVSEVDGFAIPVNVTLNGGLQVGQPTYASGQSATINRQAIFTEYTSWVSAHVPSGMLQTAYDALVASSSTVDGQPVAILNPGIYLASGANVGSALNSVWDTDLGSLFTGSNKVEMIGDDSDYYEGTPTTVTIGPTTYDVLDSIGYTDSAKTMTNGNEFHIFSPETRDPSGAYQTNESAGEMVWANDGVFADASANVLVSQASSPAVSPTAVVEGLERDIVSALNRGVALLGNSGNTAGSNSVYWGTETNWYPSTQTYNYFSRFMHTAKISGTNIFNPPSPSANDAQSEVMGQAYGFGFDESPVHAGAGQPNVPSKFDPVPAGTSTITVTFTPWTATNPGPGPGPGPGPASGKYFVVGSGFRTPDLVSVYDADSGQMQLVKKLQPFGLFWGGVRVATGDVNGDGTDDIIAAQGPTGKLMVKVFDGNTFNVIDSFQAFSQKVPLSRHIGLFVASGDVNNDGYSDIIVGADAGWTADVRVFSGKDGSLMHEFLAFTGPMGAGGARVSAGDLNKDGFSEIVVGSGKNSSVAVFDGSTYQETLSFNPFPAGRGVRNQNRLGVFVQVGDVDGDGVLDIVAGTGGSTPSKAAVFNSSNGDLIETIFSDPKHFESAILGLFDWDGDGKDDVMQVFGPGMPGKISVWENNSPWSRIGYLPVTNGQCGIWLS